MRKALRDAICALFGIAMMAVCFALAEIEIVTTDFICYDFARAVCGNEASISMLIKPGMEVHTYDPTPSDILKISECDLFIYIGGESDEWVEEILESFGDRKPKTLRLFDSVEALEEETTEEMTVHETGEEETEYDEHIWTSPKNAIAMLRAVEEAVGAYGDFSCEDYAEQIELIDTELQTLADTAKRKKLIFADRFPFLYLVKAYGFDYMAAFSSCNAESDPAARTVAALIDTTREEDIPCVYILEMSSGRIGRTIAEETGAKVLRMYSMQSISWDDLKAGETYVSLMWRNIEALKEGLL